MVQGRHERVAQSSRNGFTRHSEPNRHYEVRLGLSAKESPWSLTNIGLRTSGSFAPLRMTAGSGQDDRGFLGPRKKNREQHPRIRKNRFTFRGGIGIMKEVRIEKALKRTRPLRFAVSREFPKVRGELRCGAGIPFELAERTQKK